MALDKGSLACYSTVHFIAVVDEFALQAGMDRFAGKLRKELGVKMELRQVELT